MEQESRSYYRPTSLERIFSDLFDIYKRHFGWLFFISFFSLLLLQPVLLRFQASYTDLLARLEEDPTLLVTFYRKFLGVAVLMLAYYAFLQPFIILFVVRREEDPSVSVGKIFVETLRKYFLRSFGILLATVFIMVGGTILGLLALVIGALFSLLFLVVVLYPVEAVLVMEDEGIFASIGRSMKLVLKDFWRVTGYILLFLLFYMMASMILSTITMIPYAGKFLGDLFSSSQDASGLGFLSYMSNPLYVVLNTLTSALLQPLGPILSLLVYFHVRYLDDRDRQAREEPLPPNTDDDEDIQDLLR